MIIDKKDFIKQCAYNSHAKIQDSHKIINGMIKTIKQDLCAHDKIRLRGLCDIYSKEYKPRTFHNIVSHRIERLPAHYVPTFCPTDSLRRLVNK